ncbi:MAG: NAD(P)H-binding protein [Alphaproteobacteria bacterium]|nr:NAD(P)H-binding protein [Alphaproteobacteria bacterium]
MTHSTEENTPILITGGTGKTGRRIAERLAAAGQAIRIGSRRNAPAFDWEDAAGWEAALLGVRAVYISYYPDLLAPEALGRVEAFARLAVAGGAQRLVLLSGRNEPAAQDAEQVVTRVAQQAGADWTILRCAWFAQNFSESLLLDPVRHGEVVLPAGEVPEPFIDADDIADVAVAALTQPGHADQLYELTGPRLLTMAQATAEIARALGREIPYRQVSVEDFLALMGQQGLPPELAGVLAELFTTVLDGRSAYLCDGVQRALGRPPRDFADYARATAATGVWNQPVMA